jgi:hypothetical protein
MTRAPFDVGVGTSAAEGIVDVDVYTSGPQLVHRVMVDGSHMYCFPMILSEAKELRDMLNDAIEHVEAGGHG